MQPGTARKPAARNAFSPQPSNFDGILSHQVAPPDPPANPYAPPDARVERSLSKDAPNADRLGLPLDARGVAVAVDGEVVPRAAWQTFALDADARVEVLTAMQGG